MMYDENIWNMAARNVEAFADRMSDGAYSFFLQGFYIFGIAMILCEITSRGRRTSQALNWCWMVVAFVLGSKLPILIPQYPTIKVLLLVVSAGVIMFAPLRLCVYLSRNEKQRRYIQFFLFALLLVVFAADQFIRRF